MSTEDDLLDRLYADHGLTRPAQHRRGNRNRNAKATHRRTLREPSEAKPDPFALAGPKLKALREKSGWTVDEIADRTGVPLKVLTAFEQGDSAAASELSLPDLKRLASACCGSLADLGGPELTSRLAPSRLFGEGLSYDPNNW